LFPACFYKDGELRIFTAFGDYPTIIPESFQHELQLAADAGMPGSIDANRGDAFNGWDTDQFPIDLYELTEASAESRKCTKQ
jgi:xylose isomerase